MNYLDWYTDAVDVYRVVPVLEGRLTRNERRQVLADVPCRLYRSDASAITMDPAAARLEQKNSLMCSTRVDIRAGDELHIRRGARLGAAGEAIRAFAGEPNVYLEPFGAVLPGLAHQEIQLLQQERVQ